MPLLMEFSPVHMHVYKTQFFSQYSKVYLHFYTQSPSSCISEKGSTVKVCSNVRWILERRYHKFSLLSSGPVFQTLGPIESTSLQHRCKQTRKVWASLSKNQADRKSRRATPKQPYLSPVVCRPVIACHLVIILHNPDKCSSVCVKKST